MPSFWIADDKAPDATAPRIRVVNWARNFAMVFDAIKAYRNLPPGAAPSPPLVDNVLQVRVPFPLPAVGMRVTVTGSYGFMKIVAGSLTSEPIAGVIAYSDMRVVEPAPMPASFGPGR